MYPNMANGDDRNTPVNTFRLVRGLLGVLGCSLRMHSEGPGPRADDSEDFKMKI
jgi:hypothetical protein